MIRISGKGRTTGRQLRSAIAGVLGCGEGTDHREMRELFRGMKIFCKDCSGGCMMAYACQNWSNYTLKRWIFCKPDQNNIYYLEQE